MLRDPPDAQETPQNARDRNTQHSASQTIEETSAAIGKRLAEFKELIASIIAGRFSAGYLSKNLEAQAEQTRGDETSASRIYSEVSELLSRFREEVKEISAFDGFLIGVHEKFERFHHPAEFELNQVHDVEEHMADVSEDLELGIFTLARIREQAFKALRCQKAPEPERVLRLLEDNLNKPNAAGRATPDEAPPHGQNVLL